MRAVNRVTTLLGLKQAPSAQALESLAQHAARLETTLDQLIDRAVGGDDEALGVVADSLTVCETYFLRHPEDFATVQEHAERRAASGTPVLRVWSLGCATGEEAWSLAGVLAPISPTVHVVGSDINPRSLARARFGRYGRGSVRSHHELTWLAQADDGWQVAALLRGNVSFSVANAAARPAVPTRLGAAPDVIFCRNLLLYLEPAVAEAAVAHLAGLVAEQGLLVLGVLEGPHGELPGFERVNFPFSNAWVRRTTAPVRVRAITLPPVTRPVDPREVVKRARRLANEGRLAEALASLDPASTDPSVLYLRGCVLLERAEPMVAEATFRQVLSLDRQHVLARLQLLLAAVGRRDVAAIELERAGLEAALGQAPDDAKLDDEGVTAGYVRRLVQGL